MAMSFEDFMHDHPLWIRRIIKERDHWYILIHIPLAIAAYSLIPLTVWFYSLVSGTWFDGWPPFIFSMFIFLLVCYLVFVLPFRVCGGDSYISFLCAGMSLIILNGFL